MATLYGVNNNITSLSKRLDYSIVNVWNNTSGNYTDDGDYRIFLKQSPKIRLYPDAGGYELIHETSNKPYQACIVDVVVVVNPDNTKIFKIGEYKVNTNAISNSRADRTDSYFINILSPFVPNFNDI